MRPRTPRSRSGRSRLLLFPTSNQPSLESRCCFSIFSFFSPYGFFFIVSVQLRIKKRRWLMALHWYATFELKFKYLLCGYSTCFILVFGVLFWASVFISLRFYIKVGWYNKLLNSKTLISVPLVHEKVMSFYLLFINK